MNGKHIIYYDGFCNLCYGIVSRIAKNDEKNRFEFIPLQDTYDNIGNIDTIILYTSGKKFFRSDAVLEICSILGFPYNLLKNFRLIPVKIRDRIYNYISANRYRIFGKRNNCKLS